MASPLGTLGRMLLALGALLALLGGLFLLADRFPWLRLGRLPGDVAVEKDGFRLYLPIATSILLSLALTGLLWIALKLFGRR